MAKHHFTATHGVQLSDLDVQFAFDRAATGNESAKVYSYATDDAKKATALRKVEGYGIKEVEAPAEASDSTDD